MQVELNKASKASRKPREPKKANGPKKAKQLLRNTALSKFWKIVEPFGIDFGKWEVFDGYLAEYKDKYPNNKESSLIDRAILCIAKSGKEVKRDTTKLTEVVAQLEIVMDAAQRFIRAMLEESNPMIQDLEKRLFKLVFTIDDNNVVNIPKVSPVYWMHDTFMTAEQTVVNFTGSAENEENRYVPVFLAIRALKEDMKRPFFIMVQPNKTIINDTAQALTKFVGNSAMVVTLLPKFKKMCTNIPTKPVTGLFTVDNVREIIKYAEEQNVNLIPMTRFAFDEYEQSVDINDLMVMLAEKIRGDEFPLRMVMMSPTPDTRMTSIFEHVEVMELQKPKKQKHLDSDPAEMLALLEEIKNRSAPVINPDEFGDGLQELIRIGAIDEQSYTITKLGESLPAFVSLSPFVSSSILKVANEYTDAKEAASIIGAFVFLVINSEDICVNPTSEPLRSNFCPDSDIITIISTIMEWIGGDVSDDTIKGHLMRCGLNQETGYILVSNVLEIAGKVYGGQTIPWDDIRRFYTETDKMSFIQKMLNEVEKLKPEWTESRRSSFETVSGIMNEPRHVYKNNDVQVVVPMRPGAHGLATPGSCFIMQICHKKVNAYGSIIHRDLSREECAHPLTVKTTLNLLNPYTEPFIEGYLGINHNKDKDAYGRFWRMAIDPGNNQNRTSCRVEQFKDAVIISYMPKLVNDLEAVTRMHDAVKMAEKLMMYTPRCILARNEGAKVSVAITSTGTRNYTTRVFLDTETNTIPYHLNKTTIDYLAQHIDELNSPEGSLVIAVTGEKFMLTEDDDDSITYNPVTCPSYSTVFLPEHVRASHMVVLSNREIPRAANYKLRWCEKRVSAEYTTDDAYVYLANHVCHGVVKVTHANDSLIFMKKGKGIGIDGRIPEIPPHMRDIMNEDSVRRSIDGMLDRYAACCIGPNGLTQNIALNKFTPLELINEGHLSSAVKKYKDSKSIPDGDKTAYSPELLGKLAEFYVRSSMNHIDVVVPVNRKKEVVDVMKQYRADLDHEAVARCDVVIYHRKHCPLSKGEFIARIQDICKRFGAIVCSGFPVKYIEGKTNGNIRGMGLVSLYGGEFSLAFVRMVSKVITKGGTELLKIPPTILPSCIATKSVGIKLIEKWIAKHGLEITKIGGTLFCGQKREVERALKLVSEKDTTFELPFKSRTLADVDMSVVAAAITRSYRGKWLLDREGRRLFVPEEVEDAKIDAFLESISGKKVQSEEEEENEILYDYYYRCEDEAVIGSHSIPLYRKDGSFKMHNFCVTCALQSYTDAVNGRNKDSFYKEAEDKPRFKHICGNMEFKEGVQILEEETPDWPATPIGQLLWSVVSEPKLAVVAKVWFTLVTYHALHSSQYFDCCPLHPEILLRVGSTSSCRDRLCRMYLCGECKSWHIPGQCPLGVILPPGYRICPGCHRAVEKSEACNHMACKCGKHFCYYCGTGPWNDGCPVYTHLSHEHGGCFNDPPDYRMFCKGQAVPSAELEKFYKKYPQLKELKL